MLFGRQPLYRLELPPRLTNELTRAPSGNRTRALRLGKAAFWAAELPARRLTFHVLTFHVFFLLMGQVGIEPTPAVLQTAARPSSCRPGARGRAQPPHTARVLARKAPPVGLAPTTSCLTSKRSCCLSYGGVRCVSIVKEPLSQTTSAEGGGFEPPRAFRPRASAPRCNEPLCQPSVLSTSCRCIGVRVCRCGIPPLRYSVTPLLRHVAQRAEGVGVEPT